MVQNKSIFDIISLNEYLMGKDAMEEQSNCEILEVSEAQWDEISRVGKQIKQKSKRKETMKLLLQSRYYQGRGEMEKKRRTKVIMWEIRHFGKNQDIANINLKLTSNAQKRKK